jgi:hypothetical protein
LGLSEQLAHFFTRAHTSNKARLRIGVNSSDQKNYELSSKIFAALKKNFSGPLKEPFEHTLLRGSGLLPANGLPDSAGALEGFLFERFRVPRH